MFLKNPYSAQLAFRFSFRLTVISEALNYIPLYCVFLRNLFKTSKKNAQWLDWAFRFNSLTMTYFHTGIRTIIGAEAFHFPVRDGKEWYHFAMVVRLNFLSS